MDDLSTFCCQHHDCADYGKRGHGNLTVCGHYGPQQRRLLYCKSCKDRFSERKGKPGRPAAPYKLPPPDLTYATVHKTRKKGRVVKIDYRVVFGTVVTVMAALALSLVSKAINTAFVERHNGTDRNRNARKVRKSYCFSKDAQVHQAVTYFTMYSYNFCWPVRTLRIRESAAHPWQQRTPAMAAGLTDHVWSLAEWSARPSVQR